VPTLQALRLFNGTIYRWNRPCYGISEGRPHLRIENRVLPAGPSLVDEVANAAFWLGLMSGVYDQHPDIRSVLQFDQVKENFVAAARLGLGAHLWWLGQKDVPARELLLEELIPLARHGLERGGIDSADVDRYLGVLTERIETGRTGSQWLLDSYTATRGQGTRAERLAALVAATVARQREGAPVHAWSPAAIEETGGWQGHYLQLAHFMTTDLFTVNADELVDLAASMMEWRKIRHVPVEDADHRLVGLVTHRNILRLVARDPGAFHGKSVPVSQVMETNLITATPKTTTLEAIQLMRLHKVGCLPVVDNGKLVGIVTERDFMNVAGQLLEAVLQGRATEVAPRARAGEFAREGTDD
jgi:CBS domain-containing protein